MLVIIISNNSIDIDYFAYHTGDIEKFWEGDAMEEEKGNVRVIRNFMIKSMQRYMSDMELMKNIVIQNEHAFDTKTDMLYQLNQIKGNFKAVIDYNFHQFEVDAVDKE
jgi:hypothetical protein